MGPPSGNVECSPSGKNGLLLVPLMLFSMPTMDSSQAWDLLESTSLFKVHHIHDQELSDACHLADMIALLGPSSLNSTNAAQDTSSSGTKMVGGHQSSNIRRLTIRFVSGNWTGIVPIPQDGTIESLDGSLEGDEKPTSWIFFGHYFVGFRRSVLPPSRLS